MDLILSVKYAASVLTEMVPARTKRPLWKMVLMKVVQLSDVRNDAVLL
jgi:hypothetical protein